MKTAEKAGIAVLGLVGLYLLSGQAGGDGSGGGSGGGSDRAPGDTVINFPELDLSQIWGDQDVKKTPKPAALLPDSPWTQETLDIWGAEQPWYKAALPGGEGIGNWFRAQPESTKIRSNILNPQPMPASIYDTKKQIFTHHGAASLPDPVSLGLTPRSKKASTIPYMSSPTITRFSGASQYGGGVTTGFYG